MVDKGISVCACSTEMIETSATTIDELPVKNA